MSLKNSLSWSLLLCTFTPSSWAEITLDGSLGRSGALIGPNYAITADLGKQIGGNLFHSFRDFNLDQHESATFSGPDTVNNVISRVTGGNPSHINGRLSSTIPNADVYFLNPAGILFGEGAKLDVQGGFHASTADTLRLGSDGEFNASDIEKSVLTVAAPSAFGFLAAKPAAIILQDSQLAVPTGKTLSLIGGDLSINSTLPPTVDENGDPIFSSALSAKSGRFNLASVASAGEVVPTESGLNLSTKVQRGSITVNNMLLDVSGEGGGNMFIRGGRFELINSSIMGDTTGNKNGGIINIQVEDLTINSSGIFSDSEPEATGNAGNIEIEAGQLTLTDGGQINASTFDSKEGGSITIKVDGDLIISGSREPNFWQVIPSGIFSESTSEEADAGNAGNIKIEADQITLTSEAEISSSIPGHSKAGNIEIKARQIKLNEAKILSKTEGQGEAGTIIISTAGTLNLSGSLISTDSAPIFDRPNEMSDAGEIEIAVQAINLDDSEITSETTGKGGTIILDVKDALNIQSGGITTQSRQTGDAGKINIAARQIKLTQGGEINSTTYGSGKGGSIKLNVSDTLTVSGRKSTFISSRIFGGSNRSEQMGEAGDAGTISIEANKINLIEGGEISTSTNSASGGNINIIVPESLYLYTGTIATDVRNGQGDGGEIKIDKPDLVVLNNSKIRTNADQGWGGKIHITADEFIRSADSLLDASSNVKARSGGIKIEADSYVGNGLITSPKNFLNPPSLQRCETRFAAKETRSRFIRANRAKMRRDELKEGVWGSQLDF